MAVVLSSEENNYFSLSTLRRTHSGKFAPTRSSHSSYAKSSSKPKLNTGYTSLISLSNSPQSSNPSSPRTLQADSTAPSFSSTPASSLSLDNCDSEDDADQIVFPSYDHVGYYEQVEDLEPPVSPRDTGYSYTVSPTSNSTSTNISRADSPELVEHAEDDTAVRTQPSRHVDYLSHNWKEEDIWSSWKHIVSKRGAYSNSARLENASWRTWAKSRNKLKTVSPETLNWLKDCDVTWLYGPLQTGSDRSLMLPSSSPCDSSSRLSKSNSFLQKKPILKKRSMSEIMLQKSLSALSLLKQAAAAVQAQQSERRSDRPLMGRTTSDYVEFPFSSRRRSRQNTSVLSSVSSSGLASPNTCEKHIHFNEQVEQCIALEMKGEDDEEADSYAINDDYDSDSDDGALMMKRSNSKRKFPMLSKRSATPRNSFSTDSKTIAMLPSTTLKYREDTPEPQETAMKHSNGFWSSGKLSPSPSQETLRPSKPSTRILLSDEDDDDEMDVDWQPPSAFANRKDSVSMTQDRMGTLHNSGSSSSLNAEPLGMKRTPSGMFMPLEEDEDDVVLFSPLPLESTCASSLQPALPRSCDNINTTIVMGRVGRFVCVGMPFALTVASLICILIVTLTGVTNNGLFKVNTQNLSISTSDLSSLHIRGTHIKLSGSAISSAAAAASSVNITAADLGLFDAYTISLWNYCYFSGTTCTPVKFDWASNAINI